MNKNASLASSFLDQYGGAYGNEIFAEDFEAIAAEAEAEAHAKLLRRSDDAIGATGGDNQASVSQDSKPKNISCNGSDQRKPSRRSRDPAMSASLTMSLQGLQQHRDLLLVDKDKSNGPADKISNVDDDKIASEKTLCGENQQEILAISLGSDKRNQLFDVRDDHVFDSQDNAGNHEDLLEKVERKGSARRTVEIKCDPGFYDNKSNSNGTMIEGDPGASSLSVMVNNLEIKDADGEDVDLVPPTSVRTKSKTQRRKGGKESGGIASGRIASSATSLRKMEKKSQKTNVSPHDNLCETVVDDYPKALPLSDMVDLKMKNVDDEDITPIRSTQIRTKSKKQSRKGHAAKMGLDGVSRLSSSMPSLIEGLEDEDITPIQSTQIRNKSKKQNRKGSDAKKRVGATSHLSSSMPSIVKGMDGEDITPIQSTRIRTKSKKQNRTGDDARKRMDATSSLSSSMTSLHQREKGSSNSNRVKFSTRRLPEEAHRNNGNLFPPRHDSDDTKKELAASKIFSMLYE